MKLYANRVLPILLNDKSEKYINVLANYLPTRETQRDVIDLVSVLEPNPSINCPPGRLVPAGFWKFNCHQISI